MQILETIKPPTWKDRLMEWPIGDPVPVAMENANTVRAEISKVKKYIDPDVRFKTWEDVLEGSPVLMVERLPNAKEGES